MNLSGRVFFKAIWGKFLFPKGRAFGNYLLFFEYNKKTFYSNFNGYSIGFQAGTTGDYESLSKPMQNLYPIS